MSEFAGSQNKQPDDYVNINNLDNIGNVIKNDPVSECPKANMSINMNEIKISEQNKKRTKIEGLESIGSVTKYLSQTKVEF